MRVTADLLEPMVLVDALRLTLVYAGFALAMLGGKIALLAARRRDWERTAEGVTLAAAILTPALFLAQNFGQPLKPLTAVYVVALATGALWAYYRVRFQKRLRALRNVIMSPPPPLHRR